MKYIIKKHCVATELCTIAIGRIQDYYYGKPKYHISRDFFPTEEQVDLYGFDTYEDASDAMSKRLPRVEYEKGDGMWDIEYSILQV